MRSLPWGRRPSVSPANICWAGTPDRPCDNFVRQGNSTSWVVGSSPRTMHPISPGHRESTPIRALHVSGGADDLCVSKSTRSTGRPPAPSPNRGRQLQTGGRPLGAIVPMRIRRGVCYLLEDETSDTAYRLLLRLLPEQ